MGFALKGAVALIAAALLASFVDVGDAVARLGRLDPFYGLLTAGLVFLTHGVNALKLGLLLPERPTRALFVATLATQAYTLLLPGQIAGEAAKAYRLGVGRKGQGDRIASSVMFDKLTGLIAGLVVTLAGLAGQGDHFGGELAWLAGGALLGLAAAGGALTSHRVNAVLARALSGGDGAGDDGTGQGGGRLAGIRRWLAARLDGFLATWRNHAGAPRLLAASLIYGVAAQGLAVASAWTLALGLGVDLPYGAWCVVIGALTVILLAPVTVGGVGVRELSLVGLLGLLDVPSDQALAVALMILAFQLAVAVIGLAADLLTSHDDIS